MSLILDIITQTCLGQLPVVKRFIKGVLERHPRLPKYKHIWNVKIVLNIFRHQCLPAALRRKTLSVKVAFLMYCLSVYSCHIIKVLSSNSMWVLEDEYILFVNHRVKQTRVGFHIKPIPVLKYSCDIKIFIVT